MDARVFVKEASSALVRLRSTEQANVNSCGIVMILDVSHSMTTNGTLAYLLDVVSSHLIPSLPDGMAFACVTFSTAANVVYTTACLDAEGKARAQAGLRGVTPGPATNLERGLDAAYAVSSGYPQHNLQWLILTDGVANAGSLRKVSETEWSDPEAPAKLASKTSRYKTHVQMFQTDAFLEFGKLVCALDAQNSTSFSDSPEDLALQFSNFARSMANGHQRVKIVIKSDNADDEVFYTNTNALRDGMAFYVGGTPTSYSAFWGEEEFWHTMYLSQHTDVTDLEHSEAHAIEREFAVQIAYNRLKRLNNAIIDKAKELEVVEQVDATWVEETEFEIVSMTEDFDALNVESACFRSLAEGLTKVEAAFQMFLPVELTDYAPLPEPLRPTDADMLGSDGPVYRSLCCDYIEDFESRQKEVADEHNRVLQHNMATQLQRDSSQRRSVLSKFHCATLQRM